MGNVNPKLPNEEVLKGVIELYLLGESCASIGASIGVTGRTIGNWMKLAGVNTRTPVERQASIKRHSRNCQACQTEFIPTNSRHVVCFTCTPDRYWRARYQRYGITKPEYDILVEKQNGQCALCLVDISHDINTTIDHCHKTGIVRGILCRGCNMVLARFEDPEYIARAFTYLKMDRG